MVLGYLEECGHQKKWEVLIDATVPNPTELLLRLKIQDVRKQTRSVHEFSAKFFVRFLLEGYFKTI